MPPMTRRAPSVTPTPIPALAPVDRPPLDCWVEIGETPELELVADKEVAVDDEDEDEEDVGDELLLANCDEVEDVDEDNEVVGAELDEVEGGGATADEVVETRVGVELVLGVGVSVGVGVGVGVCN